MLVIGVGVFLLLNTTGAVPWGFWLELVALWPVALIALGVRLLFDRSRLPAAVLLSPLILLATMTWVAARGPHHHQAVGRRVTLAAERPDQVRRWTLDGRVAYGELNLHVQPGLHDALLAGEAIAARTSRPVRLYPGDESARVVVGGPARTRILAFGLPRIRWSRWDIAIAPDLPVDVDLRLALADGKIDLVGVEVTSLGLEGAFNDVELRLGVPVRDVRLDLEGAFNSFTLVVPPSVPIRLYTDGFLNTARGGRGGTGPGYRVRLDGAFNQIDVERQPER